MIITTAPPTIGQLVRAIIAVFGATAADTARLLPSMSADLENAQIIGVPRASCDRRWLSVRFETNVPFQGRIYVNGRAFDRRCSEFFTQNQLNAVLIRLSIIDCANVARHNNTTEMIEPSFMVWTSIRVDFHPTFITRTSQVFRVKCQAVRGVDYDLAPTHPNAVPTNTICVHHLTRDNEPSGSLREMDVGEPIRHRWECSDNYGLKQYAMLVRNCDVLSRSRHAIQIVDGTGCTVDEALLTNLSVKIPKIRIGGIGSVGGKDEAERLVTTAQSHAFKFLEEAELRFRCAVSLIPRASDYSAVEIPKCSISKTELLEAAGRRTDDDFQFVTPNPKFPGIIEAATLTSWIRINDLWPIRNVERATFSAFTKPVESSMFTIGSSASSQIQGILTASAGSDDFCGWRTFNWVLLLWSTASALVWLGFLGRKIVLALRRRQNSIFGDGSSAEDDSRYSYRFPHLDAARVRQTPYGKKYRNRPGLFSGSLVQRSAAAAWLSEPPISAASVQSPLRRFPTRY